MSHKVKFQNNIYNVSLLKRTKKPPKNKKKQNKKKQNKNGVTR